MHIVPLPIQALFERNARGSGLSVVKWIITEPPNLGQLSHTFGGI